MAIFDKILKGLGFEDRQPQETVLQINRQVDNNKQTNYDNFNLHEKQKTSDNLKTPIKNVNAQNVSINSLLVHSPKNHSDIQTIVDYLVDGKASIVNISGLQAKDKDRILDFLSGAVYACRGKINRLQGELFIVVPQNLNIVELQG